LFSQTSK
jgi:hypothetical protein